MTIKEYITASLGRFGVTEQDIELLLVESGLNGSDAYTGQVEAKKGIYRFIPVMLAGLANVSEGGYSVSYNVHGIKEWYGLLASELGLENAFKPKVRDKSFLW